MAVLAVYVVKLRLSKYLSIDMFRCVLVFKSLKFNIFHAFLVIFLFVVVFFPIFHLFTSNISFLLILKQ